MEDFRYYYIVVSVNLVASWKWPVSIDFARSHLQTNLIPNFWLDKFLHKSWGYCRHHVPWERHFQNLHVILLSKLIQCVEKWDVNMWIHNSLEYCILLISSSPSNWYDALNDTPKISPRSSIICHFTNDIWQSNRDAYQSCISYGNPFLRDSKKPEQI